MTTFAVGPRIATETAPPRRRRMRVMLIALAISLLVHAAVAAVLLWPATGSRDAVGEGAVGEGAALVVEIVGAAPQAIADTPAAAIPPATRETAPAETVTPPPAVRPAVVEAPVVRPEPEPNVEAVIEPLVEIERIAELAAIEPAAGPPLKFEPAEPGLTEPGLPAADVAALVLPTPTPKPALAAALAEPSAAPAATAPLDASAAPTVAAPAPAIPGTPGEFPVPAAGGTTSGAALRVTNAEPGAVPVNPAPGLDRAPLFDVAGLDNPWPDYPRLARRRGQEGEALLAVTVLADGAPAAVELRASSGYALLDEAALEAVRRWRFLPALAAGQPVQAVVHVPVVFRLE